ncbi:MAG: protein kinase [Planctomycetota bacterium]
MPPEQADGQAVDERADVYGLGALLYALLCGEAPFQGAGALQVLQQVLLEPPRPPSAGGVEVPAALEALVLRCLERDPARRYPSAGALADDLARFGRGELRPRGLARRWPAG